MEKPQIIVRRERPEQDEAGALKARERLIASGQLKPGTEVLQSRQRPSMSEAMVLQLRQRLIKANCLIPYGMC